ncbi:MAG: TAXI family TRAP transporter solute-binding subunit [Geminicoccaceae bacterium]|nr:TAXI family TRAP transporter solute-binding subunit [Geminicoccaceae bacterium]MCX8100685.1 TAXI family TRAP transporter solute-binding subunit [Geminicoccaceae bacterium]
MRGGRAFSRRELARRTAGLLLAGATAAARAQEGRFFRIATGPVGGSVYTLGGLLAEAVSSPPGAPPCELGGSCGVPGLVALAQSSAGSLANLEQLALARVESALVRADLAEAAQRGDGEPSLAPLAGRLRTLARLVEAALHLLVRGDAPIGGPADLAGRRLGLEEAGSGTLALARLLLAAFGVEERSVELAFLGRGAAVTALAAGSLDALLLVGPWPVPTAEEAIPAADARLLPLRGPAIDRLVRRHAWLGYHLIPFASYPGQPAVETVAVPLLWLVRDELEEELAYALAAALWRPESLARLRAGHPQGRELALEEAAAGLVVPLHAGARRWYREQGLLREP